MGKVSYKFQELLQQRALKGWRGGPLIFLPISYLQYVCIQSPIPYPDPSKCSLIRDMYKLGTRCDPKWGHLDYQALVGPELGLGLEWGPKL